MLSSRTLASFAPVALAAAICSLLFPVSCFLFPVCCLLFPVCCLLFPVSCLLFAVCCLLHQLSFPKGICVRTATNTLMPPLPRFLRFNLVGVLGAAVQLTTVAFLNHLTPHHYLLTSTAALELTLVHNLTWHIHYTWRDRAHHTPRRQQILRFHLANGLTSLAGNLALMGLLVHKAHVPVVAANAAAIAVCSLLNFFIGNSWVFFSPNPQTNQTTSLLSRSS